MKPRKIFYYLYALRPYQWVKNGFVFLPLIFGQKLNDSGALLRTIEAFFSFCAAASAVYLINDLMDLQADRLHPIKKHRPLAQGHIKPGPALGLAAVLLIAAVAAGFCVHRTLGLILICYIVGNLLYSSFFKQIVIVDVMLIGFFFLLRLAAGAVVVPVAMSEWLLICTTALALFLGFNKRRHELITIGRHAGEHRRVLEKYSIYFIDQMVAVLTASTVVFYTLYTVDESTVAHFGGRQMLYTVPFVYYGIFRYLYLVHKRRQGGDPARIILKDGVLQINLILWLATAIGVIYFKF